MFVQEFHGKVRDAELCRQQMEAWTNDLKPGADGFLGSTSGITDNGTMVSVARFESEEAARRNSARPEQGKWFEEFSKAIDGEVTFHDCGEVDLYRDGGSNDAGFVQIMEGHARDADAMRAMEREFADELSRMRPDLIGSVTGWEGDGNFVSVAYFTSESEARANETAMASDDRMGEYMAQMDGEMTYYDLRSPIFA